VHVVKVIGYPLIEARIKIEVVRLALTLKGGVGLCKQGSIGGGNQCINVRQVGITNYFGKIFILQKKHNDMIGHGRLCNKTRLAGMRKIKKRRRVFKDDGF